MYGGDDILNVTHSKEFLGTCRWEGGAICHEGRISDIGRPGWQITTSGTQSSETLVFLDGNSVFLSSLVAL